MKSLIVLLSLLIGGSSFAGASPKTQVIDMQVNEKGFEPNQIDVKPGTAVTLKITRKTDATCATTIKIPSKNIKKDLPLNKTVSIDLGKLEKGEVRFACGMNMVDGQIVVK